VRGRLECKELTAFALIRLLSGGRAIRNVHAPSQSPRYPPKSEVFSPFPLNSVCPSFSCQSHPYGCTTFLSCLHQPKLHPLVLHLLLKVAARCAPIEVLKLVRRFLHSRQRNRQSPWASRALCFSNNRAVLYLQQRNGKSADLSLASRTMLHPWNIGNETLSHQNFSSSAIFRSLH
jgi:hypothetical protein